MCDQIVQETDPIHRLIDVWSCSEVILSDPHFISKHVSLEIIASLGGDVVLLPDAAKQPDSISAAVTDEARMIL